jgi:L-rhamnose mutarotase
MNGIVKYEIYRQAKTCQALGKMTEEMTMPTKLYYALDLKNDPELIAKYRAWHAPGAVPAAINKSIRDAGIDELEIFLAGNRMFMILTPGPRFDPAAKAAADAASPAVREWETLMWQFQQPLPFAAPGEKWVLLENIYSLSEQT